MATPKIFINGKEVKSLNDLPQNVRNILSDDNNNGIPDIAENPFTAFAKMGDIGALMKSMPNLQKNLPQIIQGMQQGGTNVTINGKEYKNLADIPESDKAEIKAQFSQMQHLNPNAAASERSETQRTAQQTSSASHLLSRTPASQRSEIPITASPAIQEKQDKNRVVIFVLGLMALAGYVIFQYFIGA